MRRWSPFRIRTLLGFLLSLVLLACSVPQEKKALLHGDPPLTPIPSQPVGSVPGPTTPVPSPSVSLCPAVSPEWQCGENQVLRIRTCMPSAYHKVAWACYEDLAYGFALEYPAEWKWTISMDTRLRSDVKIAKRHEFRGVEGALEIDIWAPSDPDLARWLRKHQEATGPDLIRITEPNAKVGGYPAVAFVMDDVQNPSPMLTVYVSNGQYVYRLWFTLYCDPAGLPILRQILDTFRFSARAVPAEIPEDVWQEVQRAFGPPRCAPPPPTPGPAPTPRPVVLPSAEEVQQWTANWKAFEDAELGVRFRYPPEYEIRIQSISARRVGVSIDRPQGEGREIFVEMLLFRLEKEDPQLRMPEGLEAWVRELPEDENPIPGGGPIRVVEEIWLGGRPAFVIQKPLWPGDPPNLQSVIVVGRERLVWVALASPLAMSPEQVEQLWPLQMAFLTTLEVTR